MYHLNKQTKNQIKKACIQGFHSKTFHSLLEKKFSCTIQNTKKGHVIIKGLSLSQQEFIVVTAGTPSDRKAYLNIANTLIRNLEA